MTTRVATGRAPVQDIDDMSDDSLAEGMPTPDSAAENKPPVNRAASKTTKKAPVKSAARRTSAGKKAAAASKPSGKRAPLKDTTNTQDGNETEEVDDFAQSEGELATKMAPRKKTTKKPAASKARPAALAKEVSDSQPESARSVNDQPKPSRARKPRAEVDERVVPETQPDGMVIDVAPNHATEAETGATSSIYTTSTAKRWAQQPQRLRHGSTSDTERPSDPTLRRQLTDMTRKFDALNLKYRSLEDVVKHEGEDHFAKLKKLTDQQTKASELLISSLKAELAAEVAKNRDAASGQAQLDLIKTSRDQLDQENKTLKASFQQAQSDLKIMHAKLAATRAGSASVNDTTGKVPSSAVKQNRSAAAAHSEVAKETRKQLLKEDLYGDLTGLLIRDVKRNDEEEEDIFDCIQTGRNGSKFSCPFLTISFCNIA